MMKQICTTETLVISEIDDDAPTITQADFDRAKFRVAGKEVSRQEWQRSVREQIMVIRSNTGNKSVTVTPF